MSVCEQEVPWGGGREIDIKNGEGREGEVSLATGPEDNDNGMSGTTPIPALVSGILLLVDGREKDE